MSDVYWEIYARPLESSLAVGVIIGGPSTPLHLKIYEPREKTSLRLDTEA